MSKAVPQSVAVVVAHPDDEVLAFGGTIARHVAKGDSVHILILATGLASRGGHDEEMFITLRAQAGKATAILGAKPPEFADFPDNRMDTVALLDVVQRIEAFFDVSMPDLILTHHAGDLNVDHRITAQAVLTAARPLPGCKPKRIYAGEVLSSSEYSVPADRFIPNTYVDITPWLEVKKQALACYRDEVRTWPHPRSPQAIEHQVRLRGSEVGLEAAEALCLIRAVFQ
jgi:LmbE family N-acetylglucosaminyl deacetylase